MAHRRWSLVALFGTLALTVTASHAAALPSVTPAGQLSLPYSHRFTTRNRLVSTPTFTLASGLRDGLEASLRLALDSDIQRSAAEFEPRLTYQLGAGAAPWSLSVATAFNSAAVSADLALSAAYDLGPLALRASTYGFSSGYGVGGPTAAMGLGIDWRILDWITARGDYGGVVYAQDLEAIANQLLPIGLTQAWRAGFMLGAAGDQSLELYVTNSHTHTLQGLSRGSDQIQVGFEYSVPLWRMPAPAPDISLPPFKGMQDPFAVSMRPAPATPVPLPLYEEVPAIRIAPAIATRPSPKVRRRAGEVLSVRMGAKGYTPAQILIKRGTVVRWVNHDRISHTTTAKGLWDSLWKKPGKIYERRFDHMGIFPYQCKRHPHERGIVRVI